ncbi:MAG TPA: hypothetical protein VLJ11_16855 [Bryobacteraceae bacterium]|nr:hypothetical protein [Bryobacteraceae bacterium]
MRFYRTTQIPRKHPQDPASWRDLGQKTKAERLGWTAFKFQGDGSPLAFDPLNEQPGHDPYLRNLKTSDIRQVVKLMEVVREELGPDGESATDLHWRYHALHFFVPL